jgi:hypothetical protein
MRKNIITNTNTLFVDHKLLQFQNACHHLFDYHEKGKGNMNVGPFIFFPWLKVGV